VCAGKDAPRGYAWLAGLAGEAADIDLRFVYVTLEDRLAGIVARREVDGLIAKSWSVLRAFHHARVTAERVCDIALPDGDPRLSGTFITLAESPARSIADLEGKTLGTGRSHAYENSHAVARALEQVRVAPRRTPAYDCCMHAAVAVLEEEVDAAVVSSYCVRFGLDDALGRPGIFRTIGETAPIPFGTFALSTAVPPRVRARLMNLLLDPSTRERASRAFPGGVHPPARWDPEELNRA
jgi:ABC-type phosphate/phosphonate transport system substrate-binding protein